MSIRLFGAVMLVTTMLVAAAPVTTIAQTSATPYTTGFRYDASRQLVGVITPDPDGSGALSFRATRNTYDGAGRLTRVETGVLSTWQPETTAPSAWSGFSVLKQVDLGYDLAGRKIRETASVGGVPFALTQYSYDAAGRLECTAVRMNSAQFSQTTDACTLGPQGSQGPDRILRNEYFPDGKLKKAISGYGVQAMTLRENTYTDNGLLRTETDGEQNTTLHEYDPYDRLKRTYYPTTAQRANTHNPTDYEEYGYDANSNLTSIRRRDGRTIAATFDGLNQQDTKSVAAAPNVAASNFTYVYDNLGNKISASEGGRTIARVYDGFGRLTSEAGPLGAVSYHYDAGSRRDRLTWPGADNFYVTYEYDNTDALKFIRRAGSASLTDKIAELAYDNLGRRTSLLRGNGASTAYDYDAASRLQNLTQTVPAGADSVTYGFLYNPSGQATRRTISNSAYAWNGAYAVDRAYAPNGLNQYVTVGSATLSYGDQRGNLTSDGAVSWYYDVENHLRGTVAGASLTYDPLGRLYQATTADGTVTRYLYDGANVIAEYGGSNNLLRRYVHGLGADEPLARYAGTGTSAEWLLADHQGSIVAITDSAGAVTKKNTYDEYGVPGAGNAGLFQYTGQVYLADLSLYHYKARAYSPTLGRFLQTDPTGYDDGLNWYGYVGNDPLNRADPTGLAEEPSICRSGDHCTVNGVDRDLKDMRNAFAPTAVTVVASGARKAATATAASAARGLIGLAGRAFGVVGAWAWPTSTAPAEEDETQRIGYHYTTSEIAKTIASSGTIRANGEGNVYATDIPVSKEEANNALFAGVKPNNGEAVVVFRYPRDLPRSPDPGTSGLGWIHPGSLRDGRAGVQFIYVGPNSYKP